MPPHSKTKSKLDPYAVLELTRGCSEQEIQKAYKKQCLKWHPDKNMDNQDEAQERFLLAKEAFELLFDKEARTEYDTRKEKERVRDEKQRERMAKADGDRKRFMEELERAEQAAEKVTKSDEGPRPMTAAEKKRAESRARDAFETIRKQLEREVNEEIKQQKERARVVRAEMAERPHPQLRLKWKKGGYDEKRIREIFGQYGRIAAVTGILLTKSGRKMCVVEYAQGEKPWGAELECGHEGEKFGADWMTPPEREGGTEVKVRDGDGEGGAEEGEQKKPTLPNGEEDLSQLSYEELAERLLGGPPAARSNERPPNEGPSWREEI